jgi:hypothetical protein
MVVWELATAVLTAAVAWFHFDGQVVGGVQFLPFAGSAAIDPDRSKIRSRSGGRREVGFRLDPQFASMVGGGTALSTIIPTPPPEPLFLLPPDPLLAPVPVPMSMTPEFGGGDQVHAPINAELPRPKMVTRLA